jgi:hypothetical protein
MLSVVPVLSTWNRRRRNLLWTSTTTEVLAFPQSFHGYDFTVRTTTRTHWFAVTRSIAAARTSRAAPDRKINEVRVALLMYECVRAPAPRAQSTMEKRAGQTLVKPIRSNRITHTVFSSFPPSIRPSVTSIDRSREQQLLYINRSLGNRGGPTWLGFASGPTTRWRT